MKNLLASLLLWGASLALVACFTSEDHEIFRLKDELALAEGPDVTFYDFVGVSPSASQDEINKAYRKKSRLIHPDKAKQHFLASRATQKNAPNLSQKIKGEKPKVHVNKPPSEAEIQRAIKTASERYGRLGVIAEVLKGSGRERYDYFLSNGFPSWRGTGYYYARFRPGLGTVLVGLFIFGGGAVHYGAMYVSWQRQRKFMERYVTNARRAAWGDDSGIKGIPGIDPGMPVSASPAQQPSDLARENGAAVLNRRQRRMQEQDDRKAAKKGKGGPQRGSGTNTPQEEAESPAPETSGPQGAKKRVQAENGKVLIVDSMGNVYLEGEDEAGEKAEFLLDPDDIHEPTVRDTVLFRLPVWIYEKTRKSVFGASGAEQDDLDGVDAAEEESEPEKKSPIPTNRSAARKRVNRRLPAQ